VTALAYIRKSSLPGRGTAAVSYEMQERAVRDLAARNGDQLQEVLSDWGRSGGSLRRRPAYQAVLEAIERDGVTVIYSFSLSRLSRSLLDFADLLERCQRRKVRIRLVQEGDVDYSSATGRAFASMAAVFAQMERELAVERNAAAVSERRERGDILGQAPYGFRLVNGALVRNPKEPLDAVFGAFRESGAFGGTARLLNERGIPTRHGRPWTHGVVSDVLRRTAPSDLAVPLTQKRAGAKPLATAIFARLLRCHCGALLTPRRDVQAPTGVSGYYCSRSYRIPGHARMHTPERPILEWARREAARLAIPADAALLETADDAALGHIENRRARVVDSYVDGAIDKAERDRRLRALDAEAERLSATTRIAEIPTIDWTWPPGELNGVLRALWDHIELDDELRAVRAEWNVPEWRG
jgi:DNA invertase Pin-like site-specific DNA recombinase